MKLHKIILLLILLSGFSIEIPAQNSLQNEIGKLEYDTLFHYGNGNGESSGTIGMSIKNNR